MTRMTRSGLMGRNLIGRVFIGPIACAALLVAAAVGDTARAEDPPADNSTAIVWSADLPTALREAKDADRVLMICINAKNVDGRETEEPAAKILRETVYPDARVVKVARDLVCVLLTKAGTSAEYDALRALGVEGAIISPQHIFVAPEGDRILLREEYWPHGAGEQAVEMMIQMMHRAQRLWKDPDAGSDPGVAKPGANEPAPGPAAPEGEPERAAWIAERIAKVPASGSERDDALAELVSADRDGDCTAPLIALLPTYAKEKETSTLWALVRVLGRPGLDAAALPIAELLRHKDATIVANAAVSLEYIGNGEKKVIAALKKLAEKSKDGVIANHAYRALGRCGRENAKVRSLLLKQAGNAKSEFASYGPCMGLAYFEGDAKAMRGVEKVLKLIGIPGGRRAGGQNTVKRGLVSWTLASIGDAKSAEFMREEMVDGLRNVKAFWVDGLRSFWETCADVCDGEKGRLGEVEAGVGGFVQFSKRANLKRYGAEIRPLMDGARKGREAADFKPKGDNLLDTGDEE